MSHVVMQAAEHRTIQDAQRCEAVLRGLFDDFVRFQKEDPSPWRTDRVPPPLVAFGKRHGVEWPHDDASRFLVKGSFAEEAQLLRIDRMVFFWAGGFELGGATLLGILTGLGATAVASDCHLSIKNADPDARVAELATFLDENDFQDQYAVDDGTGSLESKLFSLTVVGPAHRKRLMFDDSGVQDWAFAELLPQLDGEDPSLEAAGGGR
jgi:hypothetical protein